MNCPACGATLTQQAAGGVTVDVCASGCGGVWFDNFEFEKFDEPHEHAGAELLDVPGSAPVDHEQRRSCPRCGDIVLMRHFHSVRQQVEVDECAQCGGIWLDVGELGRIRGQYQSDDERREAARAYYDDFFADGLSAMAAETDEQRRKARRVAEAFKYLCPSYYVPGDQTWGAF